MKRCVLRMKQSQTLQRFGVRNYAQETELQCWEPEREPTLWGLVNRKIKIGSQDKNLEEILVNQYCEATFQRVLHTHVFEEAEVITLLILIEHGRFWWFVCAWQMSMTKTSVRHSAAFFSTGMWEILEALLKVEPCKCWWLCNMLGLDYSRLDHPQRFKISKNLAETAQQTVWPPNIPFHWKFQILILLETCTPGNDAAQYQTISWCMPVLLQWQAWAVCGFRLRSLKFQKGRTQETCIACYNSSQ